VLFNGHSPISAYFVDTLTVQHNRIEKAPWAGITLGWGWWNFDGSSGSIAPNRPTTTARNNTVSYNQIVDTVQRLGDTAPIYTLGSQPGTTIAGNYLQGVPAGHRYGLHPDEGSAYLTFRDNVLSVDKNVTWLVNSDDFGRKHDLSITQTYGPIDKVSNKNLPNSTIQDILVSSDYVWPAAAYGIAVSSGLEDSYRDVIPPGVVPAPDYALPASTVAAGGSSVPVRGAGDASRRIWLAPSGTTTFVAGSTMTTAGGAATSIAVPSAPGDYRLFVLDAQGNRSAESRSVVRSSGGGGPVSGRIVGAQSGRCVDVPAASTTNGTQVQLWDCDGSAKQRWTTSGRQLTVYGTKCLDASGSGTANGTAVLIWDCHGGLNQQWNVTAGGTVTSVQSGLCLDANNAATANGTKLILWACNGGANQRWTLTEEANR
jgi:ricin-type beta-trefoil lectin protein